MRWCKIVSVNSFISKKTINAKDLKGIHLWMLKDHKNLNKPIYTKCTKEHTNINCKYVKLTKNETSNG